MKLFGMVNGASKFPALRGMNPQIPYFFYPFTQYTIQLHPVRLQYGLALSDRLCFSVLFLFDLVY